MNRKTFGKFICALREKQKLTQLELAVKIGWSVAQFVSNVERGTADLPLKSIPRTAIALGVRPEYLYKIWKQCRDQQTEEKAMGVFNGE